TQGLRAQTFARRARLARESSLEVRRSLAVPSDTRSTLPAIPPGRRQLAGFAWPDGFGWPGSLAAQSPGCCAGLAGSAPPARMLLERGTECWHRVASWLASGPATWPAQPRARAETSGNRDSSETPCPAQCALLSLDPSPGARPCCARSTGRIRAGSPAPDESPPGACGSAG